MTPSEKKQYLSGYRLQQAKINRLTEMIRLFPEEAEKYQNQLSRARCKREQIEEEIDAVGDDILCELLSQRYLCGKTMTDVADCMNYSRRQIERLHARAIDRFEAFV